MWGSIVDGPVGQSCPVPSSPKRNRHSNSGRARTWKSCQLKNFFMPKAWEMGVVPLDRGDLGVFIDEIKKCMLGGFLAQKIQISKILHVTFCIKCPITVQRPGRFWWYCTWVWYLLSIMCIKNFSLIGQLFVNNFAKRLDFGWFWGFCPKMGETLYFGGWVPFANMIRVGSSIEW